MALTTTGLSAAIKSAIIAIKGSPADATGLQNFCDAVANGIVPYLKSNAVVTTADVGSVTSGSGAGGAVTTTGTGTIS